MVLMCWTFHAREIQAKEPVLHTGQHEALWFRGIRPTMNRTTRICRHTADTQEAIDLFDIVLEPMLNIRLQRTPGQLSVCIRMWRLRYFELLALLTLVWLPHFIFLWPSHGACQAQGAKKSGTATKRSRGGFPRLACAT